MRQSSSSPIRTSMRSIFHLTTLVVFLLLATTTTTVMARKQVSPFFDKHEEGIQVDHSNDSSNNIVHKLKALKQSAAMEDLRRARARARRTTRSLSVGSHPNLPGGGTNAGGSSSSGGGGSDAGDANDGGSSGTGGVDSSSSSNSGKGGGKGFVGGKGASAKGKGGLQKKSSKKSSSSSSGKGGKGKGSSGDGGMGPGPGIDDDFSFVNPPQPCMCTPDFCDCEGGLATDYEFVLVRSRLHLVLQWLTV
jgi:hypothetical protein